MTTNQLEPWHQRPDKLASWIRRRAAITHLHHEHAKNQRRQSLILLIFGIIRILIWTLLGICVLCGLLHIGGFAWAKALAESLPFVVMISIYANWATDLDAATAAFAALVAADSHAAVVDAQVSAGTGSNPVTAGLEADERMVPPATTTPPPPPPGK